MQFLLCKPFGTTTEHTRRHLSQRFSIVGIYGGGSHIAEGAQKPQAHSNISFCIQSNLIERRIEQPFKADPWDAYADDSRRIEEQLLGRFPSDKTDQDTAQLVDAANCARRVIYCGRDGP
jgi:hypothetical protein